MKIISYLLSSVLTLVMLTSTLLAQTSHSTSLLAVEFRHEEQAAMHILLGWSGISAVYGGYLLSQKKYDSGSMHLSWAVINAGIAGLALLSKKAELTSLSDYLAAEKTFNQILAINTGLDVAYVSTGLLMNSLGKSNRVRDFGSAIAIQGGFLLVFDAVLFWRSSKRLTNGIQLISSMSDVQTNSSLKQTYLTGIRFTF